MFIAKDNHETLLGDLRVWFDDDAKRPPDLVENTGKPIQGKLPAVHGRREQREIRTTTALNGYLRFPGVGQAFLIRRTRCQVRKGRVTDTSVGSSWGVTSHTPHTADAQSLLRINRGHRTIENRGGPGCLDNPRAGRSGAPLVVVGAGVSGRRRGWPHAGLRPGWRQTRSCPDRGGLQ